MAEPSAAHEENEPRKRRRTVEDGRVLTNIASEFGCYISREADDLGISPSTVARILIVEAIKARGYTREQLKKMEEHGVATNELPAPTALAG